jgi:hypothetical protein
MSSGVSWADDLAARRGGNWLVLNRLLQRGQRILAERRGVAFLRQRKRQRPDVGVLAREFEDLRPQLAELFIAGGRGWISEFSERPANLPVFLRHVRLHRVHLRVALLRDVWR